MSMVTQDQDARAYTLEAAGDLDAARAVRGAMQARDEAELRLREALATIMAYEVGQIVFGDGDEGERRAA